MTYAENKGVGSVTADTLKATTADLLVAGSCRPTASINWSWTRL
jgi:hypothetical protein